MPCSVSSQAREGTLYALSPRFTSGVTPTDRPLIEFRLNDHCDHENKKMNTLISLVPSEFALLQAIPLTHDWKK